MKTGDALSIFSQIINFAIFIYFIISLLKINAPLIANIVSVIESRNKIE